MCTAIAWMQQDFYFGRTLDLERVYGEEVVIVPRNFPLPFRHGPSRERHHAIVGMAHVAHGYPLFYDAMNEAGLCMAALNFPGFARYQTTAWDCENVASYELIPYVLARCRTLEEVRILLPRLRITPDPFSPAYPTPQLHWMISDHTGSLVLEPRETGLRIHENPTGVLTNSPDFDDQMFLLRNFMHLSSGPPHNHFAPELKLEPYSRGMGAIGLPGDLSSQSRFVRASFTKLNSLCEETEAVSQFFHILDSVSQTRGCCRLPDGTNEITQYTSCCNASRGIYHYTTYGNRRISAVDLHRENLDGEKLVRFPLVQGEDIHWINRNEG